MLEVLGYIILAPFAVVAAGVAIALTIGVVKGISRAFKKTR